MRNWRIISTIAAVVLAAIAGVLVWKYVTSADDRAEKDKDLVPALVAASQISRGTTFDAALADELFETAELPRDSLPPDYIAPASDEDLLADHKGQVASGNIYTGVPVVTPDFVASSQLVSTVAGAIKKGDQAITVSLDATHAVGGFVTPGDKVSVIATVDIKDQTKSNSKSVQTTSYLIPNLKVIAVGSTTVLPSTPKASTSSSNSTGTTTPSTSGANQPASLITFEVTPRQALQIVQGSASGTLYLSLNPPGFRAGQFKNPGEIVEAVNLFDQPLTTVDQVLATINQSQP